MSGRESGSFTVKNGLGFLREPTTVTVGFPDIYERGFRKSALFPTFQRRVLAALKKGLPEGSGFAIGFEGLMGEIIKKMPMDFAPGKLVGGYYAPLATNRSYYKTENTENAHRGNKLLAFNYESGFIDTQGQPQLVSKLHLGRILKLSHESIEVTVNGERRTFLRDRIRSAEEFSNVDITGRVRYMRLRISPSEGNSTVVHWELIDSESPRSSISSPEWDLKDRAALKRHYRKRLAERRRSEAKARRVREEKDRLRKEAMKVQEEEAERQRIEEERLNPKKHEPERSWISEWFELEPLVGTVIRVDELSKKGNLNRSTIVRLTGFTYSHQGGEVTLMSDKQVYTIEWTRCKIAPALTLAELAHQRAQEQDSSEAALAEEGPQEQRIASVL